MPKATDANGVLNLIDCVINVPGTGPLKPWVLPEISESKGASYADEPVIGRSFPIKTYSHSENRTINVKWKIVIVDNFTKQEAIRHLRAFRSCVYPTDGNTQVPYSPPAICTIDCKELLATGKTTSLCVVLRNYAINYPTDVAWDEETFLPYKFEIDLNWEAVYSASNLPGRDKIIG